MTTSTMIRRIRIKVRIMPIMDRISPVFAWLSILPPLRDRREKIIPKTPNKIPGTVQKQVAGMDKIPITNAAVDILLFSGAGG